MSKNDELMRQYENGEISQEKLFRLQDEITAGWFFVGLGIAFLTLLSALVAVLFKALT